ncbi:uncharacterized protein LOC112213129 isoform X2 [Bombus impatiens]|uniref:Uncharacterized protein LOC112213129 isoform X2 n=1 Tax=Bombus impatiens TaxID=132113 RepID=A0A6P8L728_BOMIM|nr:uncharacterized protein LOC112213129 isoform X2 [Bombus impatiens]
MQARFSPSLSRVLAINSGSRFERQHARQWANVVARGRGHPGPGAALSDASIPAARPEPSRPGNGPIADASVRLGPPQHCREVETELCLVCRRCGRAYPQESTLLAHQRSCYLGNQQRRGALRLVQSRYACSLCDGNTPTRTYTTVTEWRRHAETLQHRARLEANQERQQQQQQFGNIGAESVGQCGEEVHPLTDEMEDVVNQITLLAARAAAESTTGQPQANERANQDNNNAPDVKRQKLVQEVAALAGAR